MTTIENPERPELQAVFLRAHCRMFAAGMKHSTLTGKQLLAKCSAITGKAYKRGQYNAARKDLQRVIDAAQKATT